jgi:hypothetical protein
VLLRRKPPCREFFSLPGYCLGTLSLNFSFTEKMLGVILASGSQSVVPKPAKQILRRPRPHLPSLEL